MSATLTVGRKRFGGVGWGMCELEPASDHVRSQGYGVCSVEGEFQRCERRFGEQLIL